MRRILIPLDGSPMASSIIPDARRLAGPDGELILARKRTKRWPDSEASDYLEAEAELLRTEGATVRTEVLFGGRTPDALDDAAVGFAVDMVACATHGRTPLERLIRGSVAWSTVAHSSVPVLLRHSEDRPQPGSTDSSRRKIMVPLDGSTYAERALPLAVQLSAEWNAAVYLVGVVTDRPPLAFGYVDSNVVGSDLEHTQNYLVHTAAALPGTVYTHRMAGEVIDGLVEAVHSLGITDVVMASHGRTALSRVILGSIADAMVHRLHCPIIIIPALAATKASVNLDPLSHPFEISPLVTAGG